MKSLSFQKELPHQYIHASFNKVILSELTSADFLNSQRLGTCTTFTSSSSIKTSFPVNNLKSFACIVTENSRALSILSHQNTPFLAHTSSLLASSSTFAPSSNSLFNVYEDIINRFNILQHIPSLYFSDPVICVGGDRVFGHFLLQCLPKLAVAKQLDLFKYFTFVFTNDMPSAFFKIMHALDLCPPNFVCVDPYSLISSSCSTGFIPSPILSTVSYSPLLVGEKTFNSQPTEVKGYGLAFQAYQLILDSILSKSRTVSSTLTPSAVKNVYITRKPGTHRDVLNRLDLINIARRYNFSVLEI